MTPREEAEKLAGQGLEHGNKGEHEKAIGCFHKALEADPDYIKAYHSLASTYIVKDDYRAAFECYEKAKEKDPSNAETATAFHSLGFLYVLERNDYKKAIECYKNAVEVNPGYATAYKNMGIAYVKTGAIDQALLLAAKLIDLREFNLSKKIEHAIEKKIGKIKKKEESRDWWQKGNQLAAEEKYDEAVESYLKAIEENPKHVRALNSLAGVHVLKGEYEKAEELYQRAMELDPINLNTARNLYSLGFVYVISRNDYDKAIECYQKAIDIRPDYGSAYKDMGIAFLKKGELENAYEMVKQLRYLSKGHLADKLENKIRKKDRDRTNLADLLSPELVEINFEAETKSEALEKIARRFQKAGVVRDVEQFYKRLLDREELGSTAVAPGVAIPYATSDTDKDLVFGVFISRQGVDFDSVDGNPTNVFFSLTGKASRTSPTEYLNTVARLIRLLKDTHFIGLVRRARSREEVISLFRHSDEIL